MVSTTYELSEKSRAFVEDQAPALGFASTGAYLDDLVRQARINRGKQALEAKLLEALDSGPATEMTREDWDQLERNVWERHRQDQEAAGIMP